MSSTYDSTGVSIQRNADILADMVALAEEWKGESISTDEKELLGHMLRQVAYQTDNVNELIQSLYDALSISNNSGVPLDNILELIDMERQSAAKSAATLTITTSKAVTVPAGYQRQTAAGVVFQTLTELVFVGAGSDTVESECTENGPFAAAAGEITEEVSYLNGVTSVTNAADAVPGRDRETDAEQKLRHTTAVATSGERDSASISEAVGSVTGVSAVYVDDSSYPVATYVIGGDDDEVAAAIDGALTVGIETDGTTTISVYSSRTSQSRNISFTRATDLDIYIDLDIQVTDLFPADGDDQIKAQIATLFDGNNIGDDVIYLQVPGYVYQVPGCIVQNLYTGIAASPTGEIDISIGLTNRAVIDAANIIITHV